MDLLIRNARLADRASDPPVDIGIDNGRIVAIARGWRPTRRSTTRRGGSLCPVSSRRHIHLDKSRIIDRCAPQERAHAEPGQGRDTAQGEHVGRGRRTRAAHTLEQLHRARHHARAHAGRGRSRHRHARLRGGALADRRLQVGDRHRDVRVSAGGPDQLSRDRRAAGGGAEARRQGDRRRAALRHRRGRPDRAHLRAGARVRRRHRHASRRRPHARGHAHPPRARADREIQARRPGRGRPHGQAVAAAAGRGRRRSHAASRRPASP